MGRRRDLLTIKEPVRGCLPADSAAHRSANAGRSKQETIERARASEPVTYTHLADSHARLRARYLLRKGQLFITDTRTRYKATTAPRTTRSWWCRRRQSVRRSEQRRYSSDPTVPSLSARLALWHPSPCPPAHPLFTLQNHSHLSFSLSKSESTQDRALTRNGHKGTERPNRTGRSGSTKAGETTLPRPAALAPKYAKSLLTTACCTSPGSGRPHPRTRACPGRASW